MNWEIPNTYAVKHKDKAIRANSRSGGMFTAVSDYILKQKGIVYGCVLTDDLQVIHVRAATEELRNQMRGSKYVQSKMGDIFRQIKNDLDDGAEVLFSGTSCQVAGLKAFLRREYSNLFCIDIVCHGVPSPKVWRDYLGWQQERHGQIRAFDFRNKEKYGWAGHVETLCFNSGKQISSRVFTTLFYSHAILRPSCYECPFKSVMHPGDITIGDYWGIDKAAPGFNDNKGVSLVLVNNDKGQEIFDEVKYCTDWKKTRIEDSMQAPLKGPFSRPGIRDSFWNDYKDKNFDEIAAEYGGLSLKGYLKNLKKRLRKKKNVLRKKM